jgi:prepilin-type N-terminal cleavage/methylation domain-containing protein
MREEFSLWGGFFSWLLRIKSGKQSQLRLLRHFASRKKFRAGFTILELTVVVVIIGILVSFAVPQFAVTKERALDKEAKAVILLIQAAERTYRMEEGTYYPNPAAAISNSNAANTKDINDLLRTSIPVNQANSAWVYTVDSSAEIVTATRNTADGRVLSIPFNSDTMQCAPNGDRCYLPL